MAAVLNTPTVLPLHSFLAQKGERDLLRFSTAGSVDDGKSTLIGRLLHDAGGAFEDQIAAVKASKINRAGEGKVDFSLLTDGLKAEREQGITIDVAYRYFATPRRKFIIADTPGHEEYTRNMATGASTCEAAVVLVDVRHGPTDQSRRHARIARLLGIRHVIVAVNKMDLVGWSETAFRKVVNAFEGAYHVPISALEGDNVVAQSAHMPWYHGPALLDLLETLPVGQEAQTAFRLPVQLVIRPDARFRGFAGQIAGGRVRVGDMVTALPSGREAQVTRIVTYDGDLAEAVAPMSVTLVLDREIDLSRGAMIVSGDKPESARRIHAQAVAMQHEGLVEGREYLLRHTAQVVPARLIKGSLPMNGIGEVELEITKPLYFDPYAVNRSTGAFVLIDRLSNNTVGAGMIDRAARAPRRVSAARQAAAWLRKAADKLEQFSDGAGI
ncbi:MAG: GTP-binding protein [Acidobacteria bacterium]|nr:GTP-binding protein [Acidobacteriota bacterium]